MAVTKSITLEVNGVELVFDMTLEAHNKYLDEIHNTNKVGPTRNLLMRTVRPEYKDALREMLDSVPGAGVLIGGKLMEEYSPDIEITVGKSKPSPEA